MKSKFLLCVTILAALCACGPGPEGNTASAPRSSPAHSGPAASPSPVATVAIPKDGDYHSKGVVTKINLEIGSIELNHEEIKDVMPAMQMEFFVGDKKLLDGIKVGDKVDFVLRYKDPGETIVSITKTQ